MLECRYARTIMYVDGFPSVCLVFSFCVWHQKVMDAWNKRKIFDLASVRPCAFNEKSAEMFDLSLRHGQSKSVETNLFPPHPNYPVSQTSFQLLIHADMQHQIHQMESFGTGWFDKQRTIPQTCCGKVILSMKNSLRIELFDNIWLQSTESLKNICQKKLKQKHSSCWRTKSLLAERLKLLTIDNRLWPTELAQNKPWCYHHHAQTNWAEAKSIAQWITKRKAAVNNNWSTGTTKRNGKTNQESKKGYSKRGSNPRPWCY